MSPPRSIPSAGCSASGSSRPPRLATPACWAGWAGSGPSPWPASKGPAVTAPDWPAMSPQLASGWAGAVRSDRQDRRRQGKSDPLDAVSAARAALSGRAAGAPRGRDGEVEAIRALMVAKRTARAQRTQTINQARALIITGPDDIRTRFTGQTPAALIAGLAALRPRPGSMVRYHTLLSLRELGRRAQYLEGQLTRLGQLITPLVTARAPGLLGLFGIGPDTAAVLLIAAGDHPGRLRSEAA